MMDHVFQRVVDRLIESADRQSIADIATVRLSQYDPGRELEDLIISKRASVEDRRKIVHHDVSRGAITSLIGMKGGIILVREG